MTDTPRDILQIQDIAIDDKNRTVARDGKPLNVSGRAFDVLVALAGQAGELVSKAELLDRVWAGTPVSEGVLTTAIKELRQELGDSRQAPRYIETVHGHGYRLLSPEIIAEANPVAPLPIEIPAPDARRAWLLPSALAGLAAVLLALAVWNLPAPAPDTLPAGAGRALIRLEDTASSETLAADIVRLATGIHTLTRPGEPAEFRLEIARLENNAGLAAWDMVYRDEVDGVLLFHVPVHTPADDTALQAGILVGRATHTLRCLAEIRRQVSSALREDRTATALLLTVCEESRRAGATLTLDTHTARLIEAFPDEPVFKAIHAITLLTRPDHYINARADRRQAEVDQRVEELLGTDVAPDEPALLSLARELSQLDTLSLREQEAFLTRLPLESWLHARLLHLRNGRLRYAGRLDETERLLAAARRAWPMDETLSALHAIAMTSQGRHTDAMALMEESRDRFRDTRAFDSMAGISQLLYGELPLSPDAESLASAPDWLQPCLRHYAAARAEVVRFDEAMCGALDSTLRARMWGTLGETERALDVLNSFDRNASGAAMILFYPEFNSAWHSPQMWSLAADFGLISYWQDTGLLPDLCFRPSTAPVCQEYLSLPGDPRD